MGFDGAGGYNRTHNWVTDKNAGVKIQATRMDEEMDDMASAFTVCLTKDGQTDPTANLPMASFKHTGVAETSSRSEYADTASVQDSALIWGGTAGGTANALTITPSPAIDAYRAGQKFQFITSSNNSGAVTLDVNGLGAKAVTKHGANALANGDFILSEIVEVCYDGTQFQYVNARSGSGPSGNVIDQHKRLVVKRASVSTVDVDCTFLTFERTGLNTIKIRENAINLTVDITASGANGLDNGAEANSTWYYIWAVHNPDTNVSAGLLSISSTAPTLPANYTYRALVGAVYNDAGGDFVDFHQRGNRVEIAQTNALTDGTAATATLVDFSAIVPDTATSMDMTVNVKSSDTTTELKQVLINPRATGTVGDNVNAVTMTSPSAGDVGLQAKSSQLFETAQNLWYRVGGNTRADIIVIGYTF